MWCVGQHADLAIPSLCDLGRSPPLSEPQFHLGTVGLDLVTSEDTDTGQGSASGTNQGSPGWCPGPKPLEASGQFFCLIKSSQQGCAAFKLIHAESVMQSKRDGQLA